jgi:acyl carrier protein
MEELIFGNEKQSIAANDNLLAQGIIDSMGVARLIAFIEQKFGILVNDEEVVPENFKDLHSLCGYVESKQRR